MSTPKRNITKKRKTKLWLIRKLHSVNAVRIIFMTKNMTCYSCEVNLDEDEMARFMSYSDFECPYFNAYDEYKIVQKQN